MKNIFIYIIYFVFGVMLVFTFRNISQKINGERLQSPLAQIPFSLETAPGMSLRAEVFPVSQDALWQSRIATEGAKITKPHEIQQGENIITKDQGEANIVFNKILNVYVYPNTEINLIQTLPEHILLKQNTGKAEYANPGNNSLNVKSNNLIIKANNADIIVSVKKDYPYITVDVKKGSISAGYNDFNFVTQVLQVEKGQRLIFQTVAKKADIKSP